LIYKTKFIDQKKKSCPFNSLTRPQGRDIIGEKGLNTILVKFIYIKITNMYIKNKFVNLQLKMGKLFFVITNHGLTKGGRLEMFV